MKDYNIKIEFGKQAKKFRLHIGLGQEDLGKLTKMSTSEYGNLEKGKTNYNVDKIQTVASVYNMYYYEFGHPSAQLFKFENLAIQTQNIILNRKKPLKKYNSRIIYEHIISIIAELKLKEEFLIKDLSSKIENRFTVKYTDAEISGTIKNKFAEFVSKTDNEDLLKAGVGVKPKYYRIIKTIPLEMVENAKKIVGDDG